ncbi:hypothetical protein BDS110ZK25_20990 [Bradyrhizobium diazoefficiens]
MQAGVVDLAGAELGVEHGEVGDVFEHYAFDVRPLAVIAGVGIQENVVAGHALTPAERSGADRRIVERRGVRIGHLLQDVLGQEWALVLLNFSIKSSS